MFPLLLLTSVALLTGECLSQYVGHHPELPFDGEEIFQPFKDARVRKWGTGIASRHPPAEFIWKPNFKDNLADNTVNTFEDNGRYNRVSGTGDKSPVLAYWQISSGLNGPDHSGLDDMERLINERILHTGRESGDKYYFKLQDLFRRVLFDVGKSRTRGGSVGLRSEIGQHDDFFFNLEDLEEEIKSYFANKAPADDKNNHIMNIAQIIEKYSETNEKDTRAEDTGLSMDASDRESMLAELKKNNVTVDSADKEGGIRFRLGNAN